MIKNKIKRKKYIDRIFAFVLSTLFAVSCNIPALARDGDAMSGNSHMPTPVDSKDVEELLAGFVPVKGCDYEYDYSFEKSKDGFGNIPDSLLTTGSDKTKSLYSALDEALAKDDFFKPAKNLIIMIGSGLNIGAVEVTEHFKGDLIMNNLPNQGAQMTKSFASSFGLKITGEFSDYVKVRSDLLVADSSSTNTAIASGYKTYIDSLGYKTDGELATSFLTKAKSMGKTTGLVSNDWLDGAVMAPYLVHSLKRDLDDNEVLFRQSGQAILPLQMVDAECDLLIGTVGKAEKYGTTGADRGMLGKYVIYNNWEKYLKKNEGIKLFSYYDSYGYDIEKKVHEQYEDDEKADEIIAQSPSFAQLTAYTLKTLQSMSDDNGFVCVISDSVINNYAHVAKLGAEANEIMNFDEGVAVSLKFVLENPDTALIVLSDHDAGGVKLEKGWEENPLVLSYSAYNYHCPNNIPIYAIGYGTEIFNKRIIQNAYVGRVIGYMTGIAEPDAR
ncbi:MAG: alkaline phosphatase, partial [Lachnospiraceae bacterium]|nr:alkaline phosphatase [Lachnospiraceae bacterium]